MSVGRLYEGYQYVMDNFYSFGHILERFPANIRRPVLFTAINAGMKNSLRAGQAGRARAEYSNCAESH